MLLAALPSLLLVKIIGRTIDRHPSRRILVAADALACALITLVGLGIRAEMLSVPWVFVLGFGAALLQAFIDPTLNKAVNDVVPTEDVEVAVGLLAATQSLANFTGAMAGALLIGVLGIWGTILASGLGYLVSSLCSFLSRFQYARAAHGSGTTAAELSGWAILADLPLLKKILVGFGIVNFFATPTLVVLPLYTKYTLVGTAQTLGWLEASLWVGSLLGTFATGALVVRNKIRWGALCLLVAALSLFLPGLMVALPVYGLSLFSIGLAFGSNNVMFLALFQEVVPPEVKGRFFALMQAVIGFTFPFGYFLFGAATDYLSPPQVCLIQGAGVTVLALYFWRLSLGQIFWRKPEVQSA
jgi:predicted MFS family arabinose efflux permease